MHLIETGNHQVNADRNPYLSAYGVLAGSEERLDPQVLFDPFEEEFDFPTALVDRRDGQCGQFEMVRQETEPLSGFRIDIADSPEFPWIVALPLDGAQPDGLIASHAGFFIDRSGLQNVKSGVGLRADDKRSFSGFDTKQTGEIEVRSVEHVDASLFVSHGIHKVDVVYGSVCDPHEYWDRAVQINLSVEFDRRLGTAEMRPWEHRQTQIDGGGIDCVNHLVKVESVGVSCIQAPGLADKNLCDRLVNAPIPMFVRVGQVGTRYVASYAHCVEMGTAPQAGFYVPQTLTESDLSKSHGQELVAGAHSFTASRHRIKLHTSLKLFPVKKVNDLRENEPFLIHGPESSNETPVCNIDPLRASGLEMRHTLPGLYSS